MNSAHLKAQAGAADPTTRRAFVAGMARSLLGLSFGSSLFARGAAARPGACRPRARQVIYLFLRGGMSHLDTLDPKPGTATGGPTQAVRTRADGVLLGQYFPKLAQQMDKAAVVSSMTSKQGAHPQAQYLMRTSFDKRGTIQHPSLGAWIQRHLGVQNASLPGHVLVGGGADMPTTGFLPPQFAALPIGDPEAGLQHSSLPRGVTPDQFARRLERLAAMNREFASGRDWRTAQAYDDAYSAAVRLMRSEDLAAFDIGSEPDAMQQAYGKTQFGAGCLLARRLCEHGVRCVEVISDGWDTHADNFDRLDDLTPAIDQALAALLADLDARGMLDETLVVLATEFGRTPDIDNDQGRNHYPKAFSCLMAGGGVRGGWRYGKTDEEGREVVENPVSIQDFNATIAYAMGVPTDVDVLSPSGRPFKVADKGAPILDLFG